MLITFVPDGCEWAEAAPVLLSPGFLSADAGVGEAAAQLPDCFSVRHAHSTASVALRVSLDRSLDLQLLDSQRQRLAIERVRASAGGGDAHAAAAELGGLQLSTGAALAAGRALTATLSVPVWVINATQLPLSAGLLALSASAATASAAAGDAAMNREPSLGAFSRPSEMPGGGASAMGAASAASSLTAPSIAGLRTVDSTSSMTIEPPASTLTVAPNSIELLSYPYDPRCVCGQLGSVV